MGRLLVFDTHPIPYRVPVFRAMNHGLPWSKVYFLNPAFRGGRWWFREREATPNVPADLEGFRSETIGTDELGLAGTWRRLGEILRAEKPSALLLYGYYLPEHWMLRVLCARLGIELFFCGETFFSTGHPLRRLTRKALRSYFFKGVSRFFAIGERTERFYRQLGLPAEKIRRAPYCVDISFFDRHPEESKALRDVWRRSLNLPEDAFVLLFVGRGIPRKRPEDALGLLERLTDLPRVHLVFAGEGAFPSGDRVRSLGFQSQSDLVVAYHGADLLFVPSELETWGLVVNEAFAAGLPALVTEACGAAEDLVVPDRTGFTYPVGDLERAQTIVRRLLDEPRRLKEMGEKARAHVRESFEPKRFARAVEKAFREVSERPVASGEPGRPTGPSDRPRFQPVSEG